MPVFINRQNKSTLFARIFGSPENKAYTLQLYNAMNGTDFTNPDDLELTTLETVVYMGMHNDVSFMLDCMMNLYEHQSTANDNIPLRFLWILSQVYSEHVHSSKLNVYGEKAVSLPAPKCIVFYNGVKDAPERKTLLLSDSFIGNKKGDAEVAVHFININKGNNENLKEACKPLQEYCIFVDTVRENLSEGMEYEKAVDVAIDTMDDNSVLKKYLEKHRAGVKESMFDEKSIEEVKEMVDQRIMQLEREAAEKDKLLEDKDHLISKKDKLLEDKVHLINEKDELLSEKDKLLNAKDELLNDHKESMSTAVKNLYDSMRKDNMNHADAVSFVAKIFNIADKEAETIINANNYRKF